MKRTLLFDGTNVAFRHFLGRYHNHKNDILKSTLLTTLKFVKKTIAEIKPHYIIFCWDGKSKNFRKELDSSYKAHRPKSPEGIAEYISVLKALLECLGIKNIVAEEGFECDDTIGTISVKASQAGQETLIVSSDKDFFQLCAHENIYVYWLGKGGGAILVDNDYIKNEFGVEARQLIDVKTLMGDKSDNIKGVSGIGPSFAYTLIKTHKTLKNLISFAYETPNDIMNAKILSDLENIPLYRELSKIKTNINVDEIDIVPTKKAQINMKEFIQICEENSADNLLANMNQWLEIYNYTKVEK